MGLGDERCEGDVRGREEKWERDGWSGNGGCRRKGGWGCGDEVDGGG